jgi:S1-C subfamily serine protease
MLFVGPPGTGKTTVAELMAKLLHGHGVLDNDRCVTVTGADLKAGYRGQTTGRVHKIVRDAKGGVLLIDEAYGIVSGPQDEFGQEAQQELLKEVLSSANASTVFILAGYEADIDAMLTTNDGMPRRFPNKVRFENFTAADCAEVARRDLVAHDQTWEDGFLEAFARLARHTIKEQRDHFGNAGWAKNTIEAAVGEMILRIDEESIPVGDPRRRHVTIADLEEAAGRSLLDSDDESSESGPPTAWSGHVADLHFDWHAGEEAPELATFDEDLTEEREALRRVKEASVHMIVEFRDGQRGGASGFLVTADGLVVTNQHVVDNARNINVLIGPERIPLTGRIVSVARDGIDLALVQVTRPDGIRPLPLGFSAELGELDELLVVGNAAVEPGQSPRVVRASVSRNDPAQDPVHFETSGAIEEGFSGGAVAHSSSGAAVGVVVGGIGGTVKMIIRSEQVRLMLAELGYRFEEV